MNIMLKDDAKNQPCIRCGKPGETRRAHYNGYRSYAYGKGRGIKPSDVMVAEFCHSCDELFSEQFYWKWPGGSKDIKRSEEFLHWIAMTLIRKEKRARGEF